MSAMEARPGYDEPARIWLKRKDESSAAFAAFVVYRDQTPPRSLTRLAEALDRGKRVLDEWSRTYDWGKRADAYTDHLDRLVVAAHEDDIVQRRREMNERAFAMAHDIQMAAASRLVGVRKENGKEDEYEVAPINLNDLDWDDIMRGFESSMKAQRLVLGLPTDVTGQITVSLNDMDAIMRGFLKLAEKRLSAAEYQALVRDCYALVQEQLGG